MATDQAQPAQAVMQQNSPRVAIMRLLQKRGQASIKDLELALGVTATAVREQLSHLMAEGVVDAVRVRGEVGRPFYVYRLTDKAQELFPKAYGTLARLAAEGCDIAYVLVTSGNRGSHEAGMTMERLAKIREEEQRQAAVGQGGVAAGAPPLATTQRELIGAVCRCQAERDGRHPMVFGAGAI